MAAGEGLKKQRSGYTRRQGAGAAEMQPCPRPCRTGTPAARRRHCGNAAGAERQKRTGEFSAPAVIEGAQDPPHHPGEWPLLPAPAGARLRAMAARFAAVAWHGRAPWLRDLPLLPAPAGARTCAMAARFSRSPFGRCPSKPLPRIRLLCGEAFLLERLAVTQEMWDNRSVLLLARFGRRRQRRQSRAWEPQSTGAGPVRSSPACRMQSAVRGASSFGRRT